MRIPREYAAPLIAIAVLILAAGVWKITGSSSEANEQASTEAVLKRGKSSTGDAWELSYQLTRDGSCIGLKVGSNPPKQACGFDIPGTTEVGFDGGLKRGQGSFFLYGLTSSRVAAIIAEGEDGSDDTKVLTAPIQVIRAYPPGVRYFVLERPPVDDVAALVALDANGTVVQRIPFPRPAKK